VGRRGWAHTPTALPPTFTTVSFLAAACVCHAVAAGADFGAAAVGIGAFVDDAITSWKAAIQVLLK
jgi:hypothetical protein